VVGEEYHFALTAPGIAALIAGLSGLGLGYAKYGLGKMEGLGAPALADFIRSGPVDGLYVRAWRQGLQPFSGGIGWVDRYVVDGAVNLFGWAALVGGERLRVVQTGKVRDYSYMLVVGALAVVAWGALGGVQ
jgi:NADH:ubiquinone oxidoreductase subunit 5 (subunit L)/multisubunit Na+/H+ antiporter MnhA subunit